MKKGWKIALISVGSLLLLVIVVVCIALWLVGSSRQLTKIVNKFANDVVQCEAHFKSVDLTIFSTFPDVGLVVDDVVLINPVEGYTNDTVASIGKVTVGVDLKAFLKENDIIVHQVIVDDVNANLYINHEGATNFDVFPASEDEDTTSSSFDLPDFVHLDKVKVNNLNVALTDEKDGINAGVKNLNISVKGDVKDGDISANISIGGKEIACTLTDTNNQTTVDALLKDIKVLAQAEGNEHNVEGKITLNLENATAKISGEDFVNENLSSSRSDLLTVKIPFTLDVDSMKAVFNRARLSVDEYGMFVDGTVLLPSDSVDMRVDVALMTEDKWDVKRLIQLVPASLTSALEGIDVDGKVSLSVQAIGVVSDSLMPKITAQVGVYNTEVYYPQAFPYCVRNINADIDADVSLNEGEMSTANIKSLRANVKNSSINLSAKANDLMGNMLVDANIGGNINLTDAAPFLPDSLGLSLKGRLKLNASTHLTLNDIQNLNLEKIRLNGGLHFDDLDVTMDSLVATSKSMDIAIVMPAKKHKDKMVDLSVKSDGIKVQMGEISADVNTPNIDLGVNNILKYQPQAAISVAIGEVEAAMDSMLLTMAGLNFKGSASYDSTQTNILRQFKPLLDIDMQSVVVSAPMLPDAVRIPQIELDYNGRTLAVKHADVRLSHSDFNLSGVIDDAEAWLSGEKTLVGNMSLTSSYVDVDQLMNLFSGMGSDADSLEMQRVTDSVPDEANPFIVPKDVNITFNTDIRRCIAFGNDLTDVGGTLTVNDGNVVLQQMGFVCKAAKMQLTAVYRTPMVNNLFVALDFHLLDIQIDELIDMIPSIDTLVPMLSSFEGNANFHLAAETFLDAFYQPKMSSLLGSAAITGKDLMVLDNSSIAQIAKLMRFKSWKDDDNKLHIDSLDVELTCFRNEIEVFPFLLNIGKYQICASGKHMLDNRCNYHLELLKNPLLAKVGVDVKGTLDKPKITLGEVKYADLYKPQKQGVVEKRTLEMKEMIRKALESNVRK